MCRRRAVCQHALSTNGRYQVSVEATNEYGRSSIFIKTYFFSSFDEPSPLPPQHAATQQQKQRERNRLLPRRNKCYICLDPKVKAAIPLWSKLSSKILHNCSACERQFCHHHRGKVTRQMVLLRACLCVQCGVTMKQETKKQ